MFVRETGGALLPVFRDGLFLRRPPVVYRRAVDRRTGAAGGDVDRVVPAISIRSRVRRDELWPADNQVPAWRIDLDDRHALLLRGRIDRIDICRVEETGQALAW